MKTRKMMLIVEYDPEFLNVPISAYIRAIKGVVNVEYVPEIEKSARVLKQAIDKILEHRGFNEPGTTD